MIGRHAVDLLMFDLDGTLIDSRNDLADSVNLTLRELGLPERPREVIYGYVGNGVRRLLTEAVGGVDSNLIARALEAFEVHYLEHLLDETRFYPGIERVLDHYRGKKKAVVTNKPIFYTRRILDGLGVDGRFDLVVGGEPQIPLKPEPDLILKALAELRVDAGRSVMIGDTVNDIQAARAAGVACCAVGFGMGDPEELVRSKPDFYARSVEELTTLFV